MKDATRRKLRVKEPNRVQGVIRFEMPHDTLPATHPARVLWEVIGSVDPGRFLTKVKSVEGAPGRTTVSMRMKLALWLYAVSRGIGSAREIATLTTTDDGFRWIVGDLEIGHHSLSLFRAEQGDAFDKLMTDILAVLLQQGVLSLDLVAQDGIRIRAAATAPSFRREASLAECREQAALHLKAVLAQADDPTLSNAQHRRRAAAARDFQRRVEAAITTLHEIEASPRPPKTPRASTTDAEARVMKMPDGGFRPAYNVQMATAGSPLGGPRTIVGVRVTNVGSDMNAVTPMLDDIERRVGTLPKVLLADANHGSHEGIRDATARGVEVLIPVPELSHPKKDPTRDQGADDEAIVAWRARMLTDEAKQLYRARAGLCELSNAHLRHHHGVDQFLIRGLAKATSVALLGVIASNLLQHASTLLA
jgi:transposase